MFALRASALSADFIVCRGTLVLRQLACDNTMQIYQPFVDSTSRVVWYGGESTQLHYEYIASDGGWYDVNVRTLGGGIPPSMSELHAELVDYYNYCQ
jgi:hypothetical protein|tara:strand:+ start:1372 stop:1662 length:291 start_codon:yes stop_codon:yes gene_type:complete